MNISRRSILASLPLAFIGDLKIPEKLLTSDTEVIIVNIDEHRGDKVEKSKDHPILNIWVGSLGPDYLIELVWMWMEGNENYRAYCSFLAPFDDACAKRHGVDSPLCTPLEISKVYQSTGDW